MHVGVEKAFGMLRDAARQTVGPCTRAAAKRRTKFQDCWFPIQILVYKQAQLHEYIPGKVESHISLKGGRSAYLSAMKILQMISKAFLGCLSCALQADPINIHLQAGARWQASPLDCCNLCKTLRMCAKQTSCTYHACCISCQGVPDADIQKASTCKMSLLAGRWLPQHGKHQMSVGSPKWQGSE